MVLQFMAQIPEIGYHRPRSRSFRFVSLTSLIT